MLNGPVALTAKESAMPSKSVNVMWFEDLMVGPYHTSEDAVRLMSRNEAISYAAKEIRVNLTHPAHIWTPTVENHLRAIAPDLQAAKAAAAATHQVGRMGELDDVT
jgi:NAD(P)-dependent dehydrogenase (short-subunit alcohol dehydrogenase family)